MATHHSRVWPVASKVQCLEALFLKVVNRVLASGHSGTHEALSEACGDILWPVLSALNPDPPVLKAM